MSLHPATCWRLWLGPAGSAPVLTPLVPLPSSAERGSGLPKGLQCSGAVFEGIVLATRPKAPVLCWGSFFVLAPNAAVQLEH